MQTVSVRISEDDLAWLAGLNVMEGSSPSDRIRGLIADARRRAAGIDDYLACLGLMREYVRPSQDGVLALESQANHHSEVLSLLFARLPELMAGLVTELPHEVSPHNEQESDAAWVAARDGEAKLAARLMRLLLSILRLAVTQKIPAYDTALLDPYLPELVELVSLMRTVRSA